MQLVQDYNNPATPLSVFLQWQLSQQPNGNRESSSTAMLPQAVRERKNLVIKVCGVWWLGLGWRGVVW